MNETKYTIKEKIGYNNILVRVMKPILSEDEAKLQLQKTINDLLYGFSD